MTSTSLTPESTTSAPEKPVILSVLPDFPIASQQCALHLQQHIDLMLLALESLEVGAGEALLALCKELGLDKIVRNRIIFWRLRCTNPWRISYTLDRLTLDQAKALVIIASYRAKPLGQLDARLGQLRAHGWVNIGVAAGHGVAQGLGQLGNAAHEGATNTENVDVHSFFLSEQAHIVVPVNLDTLPVWKNSSPRKTNFAQKLR